MYNVVLLIAHRRLCIIMYLILVKGIPYWQFWRYCSILYITFDIIQNKLILEWVFSQYLVQIEHSISWLQLFKAFSLIWNMYIFILYGSFFYFIPDSSYVNFWNLLHQAAKNRVWFCDGCIVYVKWFEDVDLNLNLKVTRGQIWVWTLFSI